MSGKTKRKPPDATQSEKLKPGPIQAGHTEIVACKGCGKLNAAMNLTSSGHCDACYFAGLIHQAVGEGRYWDWEQYHQDYGQGKNNATESPRLPYETFSNVMRLRDMGLAETTNHDRPIQQLEDMIHMWDDSIVIHDGRCDYTDPPYVVIYRQDDIDEPLA